MLSSRPNPGMPPFIGAPPMGPPPPQMGGMPPGGPGAPMPFSPPMSPPMPPPMPPPVIQPPSPTSGSIGKVKLTREREDEILSQFDLHLCEAVMACAPVHERAIKAHKHYVSYCKKEKSSIYVTESYDARFFGSIIAAVSGEYGILNSSPYLLDYEARSEQGDALADFYNAAFDFHWKQDPQRQRKLQGLLLQRRIYGSVYGKYCWNEEYVEEGFFKEVEEMQSIPITNPVDGLGSAIMMPVKSQKWVTERRKKKDSPWLEVFHFLSCYPDTKQELVKDGRFFFHRKRVTKDYVEEQGRKKAWYRATVKELLANSHGSGTGIGDNAASYSSEYIEALNATVGFSQNDTVVDGSDGLFEMFEYWTPKGYAVVVNRRIVCYYKSHILGYMPILQVRNHLVPGEHFGMSDFQVVEHALSDFQNMHNTMLSNAYCNAFPPMVVGSNVELKEFRQAYRPGGLLRIPGQDVNSMMKQLPVNSDSIDMAKNIKEYLGGTMDKTLATDDVARGGLPTHSTSATAVMQSQQSLSARQGMQASLFEAEFIQPLGEAFRDLITKLQSDEITIKLRGGKDWVKFKPLLGAYDPDLDCVPVAGSSKLSELEQKRLIELLNLAANFKIQNINLQEGFKVIVESMTPRLASRLIMDPQAYGNVMATQAVLQRLTEGNGDSTGAPGAMATSNQIGNSPGDAGMDEMSTEAGNIQTQ